MDGKDLNEEIKRYFEDRSREQLAEDDRHDTGFGFDRYSLKQRLVRTVFPWSEREKKDLVEDFERHNVSRRRFLQLLGVSIGGGAVTAFGVGGVLNYDLFGPVKLYGRDGVLAQGVPAGRTDSTGDTLVEVAQEPDFDSDWDEVTISPSNGADIADVYNSNKSSNTLLILEQGEYSLSGDLMIDANTGLAGSDSTLDISGRVNAAPAGNNSLLQGFEFDGRGVVHDHNAQSANKKMKHTVDRGAKSEAAMSINSHDPDTVVWYENVRLPDGMQDGERGFGIFARGYHSNPPVSRSTIVLRNCFVYGFTDNGFYGSQSLGPQKIEGGFYHNNNISNVRIGGERVSGSSTENEPSYVKGTHVRVEGQPYDFSPINQRGIRIRNSGHCIVEDCHVEYLEGASGGGGIVLAGAAGPVDINNTRIRADTVWGINAKAHNGSASGTVRVTNTHIVGAANGVKAGSGRDGSVARDCCIDVDGTATRNIQTENVSTSGCEAPEECADWGPVGDQSG